ncbi:phytoene desaturase family protein [Geoalkalibacter halelectricus]|uniref:FAD-dependent oxidoreductase n=1 Tax=Geoalkalibacter halelectricus TaxID=2847045 RepID=A0ABY5ZN49_9BACT|nr:FAD-dependent oxidoreductase [Geoalkalibacter halelectricus]MDO3379806.1 FAD-dependent oxidoreductase [Geoalkalibacter halelectricus]UWZ79240.1 FAD-dependent oxidoreductase [Geoalkalibacter halelectricus]
MTFDSIVVGGGVSGLSAALILARQGRKVAVVEQASRPAPLVRGFTRKNVYFDSAFHYAGGLGDGEVLDLFFRYLGLSDRIEKYPFNQAGFDCFRDEESGWEFKFPVGISQLRSALCAEFPKEVRGIDGYLADLDATCRSLPFLDPDIPADKWDGGAVVHGPTLAQVLDKWTDNRALKKLLALHTLLHGVVPEEVSFAVHASVVALYYRSTWGICGGGLALADAFEAQLRACDVTMKFGQPVKSLLLDASGGIRGVELADGEKLFCRECIVSTHPRRFLDFAPEGALKPAYRKRLLGLEETASAFILYAAQHKTAPILDGANLFLGRLSQADELFCEDISRRPLFIAANTGRGCSGQVPDGWVAICPAHWRETQPWSSTDRRDRGQGYREFKERMAGRLMERIRRQVPELADQASLSAMASPLTLRDYTGSPVGGLYGVKHRVGQYNPQPKTRISGVYLTGQASAGPGILGAMTSAFLTCGHLFGHEHLRKEVLACR